MLNEIITTIKDTIENSAAGREARFVFHSETAALFWVQKMLSVLKLKTIARERFIAWDIFKANNISVYMTNKRPCSHIIRFLYARMICRQNAAAPFFKTLIPVRYAKDSLIFSHSIVSILPQLKFLRRKREMKYVTGGSELSGGFSDFDILEQRYDDFLSSNNLFEPSWEKPPFKDKEHEYFIFYPSLIEDYAEYEEILNVENVHKIDVQLKDEDDDQELLMFDSFRTELRSAVLEIRRLHNESGIAYEDMALSAGRLDILEPYIRREFNVFNVPFNIRSGKPLAEYSAGSFFLLVDDCAQSNFSWNSIQALLMNTFFPWKFPNKNKALLNFGIKYNCVSGYTQYGVKKDIWEDAFLDVKDKDDLARYYRKLKHKILRIKKSKTFTALLKQSRNFFLYFFKDSWGDEASNVLGRCLSEMSSLAALEKNYPSISVDTPLEVFISVIKEKTHVRETSKTGVNVFVYGVAASIPCDVHFVINASQNYVTKLFRPLNFLRQDKRKLLQLEDTDVSKYYLKSYRQAIDIDGRKNILRISASNISVLGSEIPHSYYNRMRNGGKKNYIKRVVPQLQDVYTAEKNWWLEENSFPDILLPIQKTGFDRWVYFKGGLSYSILNEPLPKASIAASLIKQKINFLKRQESNKLKVSATSLNLFFKCPVLWIYRAVFKLNKYSMRAKMFDDENKGILYHEILRGLFQKIKENDGVFIAANESQYVLWAEKTAAETIKKFRAFRGSFISPFVHAMAASFTRNIICLLDYECLKYNGWSIAALEDVYNEDRGDVVLTGKVDRISVSPDYIPLIVDYKTGKIPAKKSCIHTKDSALEDFQIPVYIRLYENTVNAKVENALFINVITAKVQSIISAETRSGLKREDYQDTLDALDYFIEHYKKSIEELDWTPREVRSAGNTIDFSKKKIPVKKCINCDYKIVCRTMYH
jgi:hypothetical protein